MDCGGINTSQEGYCSVLLLSLLLSRTMEKLTGRSIESVRRNLNCLDVAPVIGTHVTNAPTRVNRLNCLYTHPMLKRAKFLYFTNIYCRELFGITI